MITTRSTMWILRVRSPISLPEVLRAYSLAVHSYLANGNSVQAAGKMKVSSQGYIRNIINDSGHYQPTVSEALNYPNILRSAGLNVDNAWIRVDSFTSSLSNYVIDSKVFYNGPVKYLPH